MRARGIGYDCGFSFDGVTRRPFTPSLVTRELQIIRDDLHCTAVRLFGNDLDQLDVAARTAAELGLEVWYSPFPHQLEPDEMLEFLADAASRAARVRAHVFVAGAEISLFNRGFLPGSTLEERVQSLLSGASVQGVNEFLTRAVALVRERFDGPVTYASIWLERVDWTLFDIVSVDAHRSKRVADTYQQGIRTLVDQPRPVAITEFGCTTFRGASDDGARGDQILEYEAGQPVRLNGDYVRDEDEQATYLRELLDIYEAEGVDAAFVCTFVCYGRPHRADPRLDLDMASWGVVKELEGRTGVTYPDMPWEPKAAFRMLAEYYAA
jgi:hypothetical protein